MNKHLIYLAFAVIVALTGVVSAGDYSGGGNGSAEQPYRISTAADMNEIGANTDDWGSHFVMVNDINLADYTGTEFNIIGSEAASFTGVFDGNSHTISNFTYTITDTDDIGLFGYVDDVNALIKDLTLVTPDVNAAGISYNVASLVGHVRSGTVTGCGIEGGSVMGYSNTGGLVGHNDGTISNCYSSASVTGYEYTGGLAGSNGIFGTISNCYAEGSVTGGDDTGGLVGLNFSTISNCYATGSVSGDDYDTGGLVGYNNDMISNCYATGSATGANWFTGGLVGSNDGTISNCYATGNVSGYEYTGGLVGGNSDRISNCYATGSVIGDRFTGGLAGYNHQGTIANCYAVGSVTGTDLTGGLVGYNEGIVDASFWDVETGGPDNGIGTGLPTSQMQTESTFTNAGWDFVEIWNIGENQTYPYLRVYPAGDLNHDKKVNLLDFAVLGDNWLEGQIN